MSEENRKDEFPQNEQNSPDEIEDMCLLDGVDVKKTDKSPRKVYLSTLICWVSIFVVLAIMLTYTLCTFSYKEKLAASKIDDQQQAADSQQNQFGDLSFLEVLASIFEAYSFEELDEETIRTEILKAYVRATGDKYAEFYTNEEYALIEEQMKGVSQGIGISIINSTVTINDVEYKALKIINVMKDSPAERAGLNVGDSVITVGTEDENTTINVLGYDGALADLRGVEGTKADFGYYSVKDEKVKFVSILREKFTEMSVMSRKVDSDVAQGVGLIKILNFDTTTPTQLVTAIEELKNQGCEKFVFDLRYNPGGQLSSIAKILSYFLDEGDTIISMRDKKGFEEVVKAEVAAKYGITAEDIGRYKGINAVVLCNESTASAAELFVANFRDHNLGEIVGTTTYGKGTVQTYMSSINVGGEKVSLGGVLKLTVYMYYPPNGENYNGIGIVPKDDCTVELSEEAKGENVYEIMGTKTDNQLVEAVKHFK